MKRIKLLAIVITLTLTACNSTAENVPDAFTTTAPATGEPAPTATLQEPTPTEPAYLVETDILSTGSVFCSEEDAASQFILDCADGSLIVSQSENRRGMDILLKREQEINSFGFALTANLTSEPVDKSKLDKNQAGFYFKTKSGETYALRLQGQYFNFEKWVVENGEEKIIALNKSFTPSLLSAGRTNYIRLVCVPENCDLFVNDVLSGRLPQNEVGQVTTIGFFAASEWDEQFGTVGLENFMVESLPGGRPETQPFSLMDDLKKDYGTFSQMGLSGAFSNFEADGFHFSPVIAYGYYAAKTGPSLRDGSVSTTINMDFTPGSPATQYAGVICRSSIDGKYIAVLRADATYTIFRDSIRSPFALLAKNTVESIGEGRSSNTIRLDCVKDTISLFINDVQVKSFQDNRFGISYGRSGIYTKAGGTPYSDAIIFSDLIIRELR